ncbi:unnamed protein product [Prorocentrum cordatum]|uniref:Uncharacterized protein n=1 Tax=Prorocentrum cordatum TaxID=2364126 RepID=A0ABN9THB4_9DINO|nr:unnamed protein product [Polarella glacialis]
MAACIPPLWSGWPALPCAAAPSRPDVEAPEALGKGSAGNACVSENSDASFLEFRFRDKHRAVKHRRKLKDLRETSRSTTSAQGGHGSIHGGRDQEPPQAEPARMNSTVGGFANEVARPHCDRVL